MGGGLLLLAVLVYSWRQRQFPRDTSRPVLSQPTLINGKSEELTPASQPPAGVVAGRDQKSTDAKKLSETLPGNSSSPAPSPDTTQSSANRNDSSAQTIETGKAASQMSATNALTPADILSQKLDLSDPVKRAEVVRQLKEIEDARKKEAWDRAAKIGIPTQGTTPNGGRFELQYFEDGKPVYYSTKNANAAI